MYTTSRPLQIPSVHRQWYAKIKRTNKQSQNKHNAKSIAQTSEQYTKSFTVWHSYVLSPNYGVSNQAPGWSGCYFNLSSCTTALLITQYTFADRTLAWYLYCVCIQIILYSTFKKGLHTSRRIYLLLVAYGAISVAGCAFPWDIKLSSMSSSTSPCTFLDHVCATLVATHNLLDLCHICKY